MPRLAPQRLNRTAIGAVGLAITLAGSLVGFIWPWVNGPWLAAGARNGYVPLRDGLAALVQRTDGQGAPIALVSQNVRAVSPLRLYADIRAASSNVITRALAREGSEPSDTASVAIFEVRGRALRMDGATEDERALLLVSRGNVYVVGPLGENSRTELAFDPPLLQIVAHPRPGVSWSGEGHYGVAEYAWSAQVLEAGPWAGPAGAHEDCVHVDGQLTLRSGSTTLEHRERDWYCAGVGLVESVWLQGDVATLVNRRLSMDGPLVGPPSLPAPAAADPAAPNPTSAEPWTLVRVGRTRSIVEYSENTIPPTYIPSQPPLVLGANQAGDLLAFDAETLPGELRWTYRSAGAIFGAPAFDLESGRIYVGSSDKRLHALEPRGLHLWSFRAGDNVATQPVVVGDVVVFGSEDRAIYGVDAETGTQRWKRTVGEAVIASPARWGDTVVIGADDGVVYALDGRTGAQHWSAEVGGGIDAAVTIADGIAYVASRDGALIALDVDGCAGVCDPIWRWEGGARFRTAATVAGDLVLLVDSNGGLHAFDRADGSAMWSDRATSYAGPLVRLGDALVGVTYEGRLVMLALDGTAHAAFSLADARLPVDGPLRVALGPTVGGGAVWLGDSGGTIYRLGPPSPDRGPAPLPVAWWKRFIDLPFAQRSLSYLATGRDDQSFVVDDGLHVFGLEPDSGAAHRVENDGELTAAAGNGVVGDGLSELLLSGRVAMAVDLERGAVRWQRDTGLAVHPPVASGDEAVWLALGQDATVVTNVNRGDGSLRWETRLPLSTLAGGVAVADERVLLSTPPAALDRSSGQPLWTRPDAGIGRPGWDPATGAVFVGTLNAAGSGELLALDATTGVERWRAALANDALDLTDQPWPVGEVVVVPLSSGAVQALDSATGQPRWRFTPPVARYGGVTVDDGRVWLALRDGGVLGLRVSDGTVLVRSGTLQLPLDPSAARARPRIVGRRVIMPFGAAVIGFDLGPLGS